MSVLAVEVCEHIWVLAIVVTQPEKVILAHDWWVHCIFAPVFTLDLTKNDFLGLRLPPRGFQVNL